MAIEMTCPTCGSHDISKNGTTRRGKQNYKCRDCNRQFVENPQWKPKGKDTRALVALLLLEKIPLAGITRATGVSDSWLQGHANAGCEAVPKATEVVAKPKGKLNVQMDELWSFVDNKDNKQWVWLAIDADTREIIGCQIGDRSRESAIALWQGRRFVQQQAKHCPHIYLPPMPDQPALEIELLRTAYAAFNARDADAALALMTSDVHWPRAFKGGFVRGPEEVRAYWMEQWSEIDGQVEPVAFHSQGNGQILVEVHQIVRDLTGTVLADEYIGHRFTLEHGLIQAMEVCPL